MGTNQSGLKKKNTLLLPIFCVVVVVCALLIARNLPRSNAENQVNVILDVSQLGGLTLDELSAIVGELKYDGSVSLATTGGNLVEGEMYFIASNNLSNFVLIDGKVVNYQYWAEAPIKYKSQNDIMAMFGIKPDSSMQVQSDTGVALRLTNVSNKIPEFWVQMMDSNKKTFEVVRITFDGYYAA